MAEEERSLEQTPTWAVAAVATVFVLVSLLLERGLHRLGKVKASLSLSLSLSLCATVPFLDEEIFSCA
jgi:hypothetical protein